MNQYQAIVLGGVGLASLLTLNPLPLLFWLGTELVLLPILDTGPFRRLVSRRRRDRRRRESASRRNRVIASFNPDYARRYAALEKQCRMIESNYQGLHGISQAYLSEQRGKLDMILESCLNRMTALQRYERTLSQRTPDRIKEEIDALAAELEQPDLNERARNALKENLELKGKLLASYSDARGNMKALATELDSMASLLEVLHQNSISMRDPMAISQELDSIVRQSEASQKVVREMEALLRSGVPEWNDEIHPLTEATESEFGKPRIGKITNKVVGSIRRKEKER